MSKKVLLIEDDGMNQRLLVDVLESAGFQVVHVTENGYDGVEYAIKHMPDLIILDVVLEGITGLDVVKYLKENEKTKHIPVVIVTALAMKHEISGIEQSGCDLCFTKPLNLSQLVKSVQGLFPTPQPQTH